MVAVLTVLGHYILNPGSAALVIFAAIANCLCATLSIETGRVFQTFERMRTTAILNMSTNVVRTLTAGAMLITLAQGNCVSVGSGLHRRFGACRDCWDHLRHGDVRKTADFPSSLPQTWSRGLRPRHRWIDQQLLQRSRQDDAQPLRHEPCQRHLYRGLSHHRHRDDADLLDPRRGDATDFRARANESVLPLPRNSRENSCDEPFPWGSC